MTRRDVEPARGAVYQTPVSSSGRSGTIAAVAASLVLHAAGLAWFALRPPMFKAVRQPAPIEVTLVPAPPPQEAEPAGGGGAEPRERLVQAPPPDRSSQPRPRAVRRPAPEPRRAPPPAAPPPATLPAPRLPDAAVVDSGPTVASPQAQEDLAVADVTAGDLGIGAGGQGPGSGGGSGGGTGTGIGTGVGPGSGTARRGEVKPREIRRPSYAEMRSLYPDQARREGLQARVRLQLLVDAAGRVADVRVVRGAGHGFDEAAMTLARRFLFEPGRRDGQPVPMWITLTYSFEIEG